MTNLDRRLTALEQLAEDVRRRQIRELVLGLPEARDLRPAETEDAVDEYIRVEDWLAAQRRAGVGRREILQRFADEQGVTVETLEADLARFAD
jgi:hypothetical protein